MLQAIEGFDGHWGDTVDVHFILYIKSYNSGKHTETDTSWQPRLGHGTKRNQNADAKDNPDLPAAQLASSSGDIENRVVDLRFGGEHHWVTPLSSKTGKE
jgi:hypothetical protein